MSPFLGKADMGKLFSTLGKSGHLAPQFAAAPLTLHE